VLTSKTKANELYVSPERKHSAKVMKRLPTIFKCIGVHFIHRFHLEIDSHFMLQIQEIILVTINNSAILLFTG